MNEPILREPMFRQVAKKGDTDAIARAMEEEKGIAPCTHPASPPPSPSPC